MTPSALPHQNRTAPHCVPLRQAMILAAGRGERMRPLTDQVPKPLQCVQGKALIEWQIEALVRAGLRQLVINVSWLQDQIRDHVGDGARWGAQVQWSCEEQALGTAGGVVTALPWLTDPAFLVVSADIFTRFDYTALLQGWQHAQSQDLSFLQADAPAQPPEPFSHLPDPTSRPAGGAPCSGLPGAHLVLVQDARHPADFSLQAGRIHLPQPGGPVGTYGNMGVYRRSFFDALPAHQDLALGPLLRRAAAAGQLTGQWCRALWENVGTAADLARLNSCSGTLDSGTY